MEVKDLMIGDLVTFKECQNDENPMPIEIVALGYQQGGGRESSLVSINGDNACDIFDIDDEIVGIPITPEILEENGFEVVGKRKYFLVPGDPSLAIKREGILGAHGNTFTIGHFWEGRKDFRWFSELTYIHELQHALRLCGIDKEIKL